METLNNERYYRKTQKLILNHNDPRLLTIWNQLTPENAKVSYDQVRAILYSDNTSLNLDTESRLPLVYFLYYVFIILMASIFISIVGVSIQSSHLITIAKGGFLFTFVLAYAGTALL